MQPFRVDADVVLYEPQNVPQMSGFFPCSGDFKMANASGSTNVFEIGREEPIIEVPEEMLGDEPLGFEMEIEPVEA